MGASRDDFVKYPRTPHLFGSRGTDDDKHLGQAESVAFIADTSLIVEEKLDGTNTGIHFTTAGRIVLQCRGHEITSGMHAQYDLFKQWTMGKRPVLEAMLADRYILFGEWLYARHSVQYRALPHFFFEFDMYDKERQVSSRSGRTAENASKSCRSPHGPGHPSRRGHARRASCLDRAVCVRQRIRQPGNETNRQLDGRTLSSNRG